MQDVVILSGVRTAVGSFQGSLKDKQPTELGAAVVGEALRRAEVEPAEVGKDMYLARVAAIGGGVPEDTPGQCHTNRWQVGALPGKAGACSPSPTLATSSQPRSSGMRLGSISGSR